MAAVTAGNTDAEVLAELGARLRAYRARQSLTVEQLAARAGISTLTLLKAEQGGNPTLRTLLRVLRALGRMDLADNLLPAPPASPLAQLARTQLEVPRRVRAKRDPSKG
jgi:transcriptional regulator with XRE-family HTH domain